MLLQINDFSPIMVIIQDLTFRTFISKEQISTRIREIAGEIDKDMAGQNPVFLGILNGSFMFLSELFKQLHVACEVSFLKVSSYHNTTSTGKVRELIGLSSSIEGRHVVIVEDIVDTGFTLDYLIRTLSLEKPASIRTITLLYKPSSMKFDHRIDYAGFEIENKFVVGFGLDYNGYGRNSEDILVKAD